MHKASPDPISVSASICVHPRLHIISPMDDTAFMQRALELAERGRGYAEPNPLVGAVLVRDGAVVAEGWHQKFGGPHAEVEALADARRRGIDPAGTTVYVTLEPCAHFGKTPPCADALIEANIARVVAAMQDPFPQVAGRGFEKLRAAGITAHVGTLEAQARRLNEPFLKRVATNGELPWVIAKWAQTLDGKIAASTGDSKWISCDASRKRVHELRGRVDAILVGVGTVVADDPQLTARDVELRRVARRVVLDPQLRMPITARLLAPGGPPVLVAAELERLERGGPAVRALRDRGVELLPLKDRCGGRLDLKPLLQHLAKQHAATNVLAEGGAGVIGSLFDQGLVDQALVYLAPKVLADPDGLDPVRGSPCARIDDAHRLELIAHERIGGDLLLDYRVRRR